MEDRNLAPPGAGLPWIELQVARAMFWTTFSFSTETTNSELIKIEQGRSLKLIEPCSVETLSRQVLIKRLPGLEDSSRFWSVFMTLSHVAIVNRAAHQAIQLLLVNEAPSAAASTAKVKPEMGAGPEAIQDFTNSCQALLDLAARCSIIRTAKTYSHPWFGPLDARGWHFLAGFHMRLHRKQLEAILHRAQKRSDAAEKDM